MWRQYLSTDPYLANLFLFYYEHEWMMKTKETNPKLARQFNKSVRYIDDLLTINNDGLMNEHMSDIYPKERELKHENSRNGQHTTYLDPNPNPNPNPNDDYHNKAEPGG